MVAINDWDYNWQETYFFKEPMPVRAGTQFEVVATYDNSTKNPRNPFDPPRAIRFGEQTTNEMCICFCEFLANNPQEANQIRKQVTRELISSAIVRKLAAEK